MSSRIFNTKSDFSLAASLGLLKKLTAGGLTVLAVLHDPKLAFLSGDRFFF
jgi:ABC-type cobalamin/Fe3+-siderophores transport system ATPase subunit